MRFRTVLFDLDGTLMDHLPAIHRAYMHTLPRMGLPEPTYEQVKRAIGGGLEHAMLNFIPASRIDEALLIYRPFWDATMLSGAEPMPGALELLQKLSARHVVSAVFTNKHGPSARAVCEHMGLTPHLRAVFGAKDTPWLKPAPEFTAHALAALGADPSTSCMVGDSPWDVQAESPTMLRRHHRHAHRDRIACRRCRRRLRKPHRVGRGGVLGHVIGG